MKKIKRNIKKIICFLSALGCVISFTLPVYAGGGGTARGDLGKFAYSYNTYNGYADPKITGYCEKYFAGPDGLDISTPYVVKFSDSFYPVIAVVSKSSANGGNAWLNFYRESYKKGQDTTSNTSKSSISVVKSALDWFKQISLTNKSGDQTAYQYLVSKGYSVTEMQEVLGTYYMVYSADSDVITGITDKSETSSVQNFSCNGIYDLDTYYQYLRDCKNNNENPWDNDIPSKKDDDSPPKFYLKTYSSYGMNKYTEYTITWDVKGSFVEGKESDYGFKVFIGKNSTPAEAKALGSTEISPCLFSSNNLVFTWDDVKNLFSFLSSSSLENRFDVFIQITDKNGLALNDNFIHFLVVKRAEIRDSNYVDKDGNEKESYGKWENGKFDYTDGRETSSDDKSTNGNGSSTAPDSNVKNDGYTNIENDPGNSQIDASATKSLIKTLETIVSTLGDVPKLLSKVYAWLPIEIITLIGTGIGLIVIVGIIKWIL